MLTTKQPKKSNNNIRYSISNHPGQVSKCSGTKIKKSKPIQQKLHKHFSQLPIGTLDQSKQNISMSNLMINRPLSSMMASDHSPSRSKSRDKSLFLNRNTEKINNSKPKKVLKKASTKKYTISINQPISLPYKERRLSGPVHSQLNMLARSHLLEQQKDYILKAKLAENRKKFNLSCGDMIQNRSKSKDKKHKKKQLNNVNLNTSNITGILNRSPKDKKKTNKKSIPTNKSVANMKKVSINNKSKASTININIIKGTDKNAKNDKNNKEKNKKSKKIKVHSKKSKKLFIFSKQHSDEEASQIFSHDRQFPINKYFSGLNKNKKQADQYIVKKSKDKSKSKSKKSKRSKSNKRSSKSSKNKSRSKSHGQNSKINSSRLNYKFAYMGSSSDGINEQNSQNLYRRQPSNEYYHENMNHQYYQIEPSEELNQETINIKQIKYYQRKNDLAHFGFGGYRRVSMKQQIIKQLQEQYMALNSQELDFLASVIVIQRNWRERRLRGQLYRRNNEQQNLQQIQNQRNNKRIQNQRLTIQQNVQTEYIIEEGNLTNELDVSPIHHKMYSSQKSSKQQYEDSMSRTKVNEVDEQRTYKKKKESSIVQKIQIKINTYPQNSKEESVLSYEELDETCMHQKPKNTVIQSYSQSNKKEVQSQEIIQHNSLQSYNANQSAQQEQETDRKPLSDNKQIINYARIYNNQLFPQITYIEYRKNLYKEQFQKTLKVIIKQKAQHLISNDQFQYKKMDLTEAYTENIQELKKTKYDIKKGYLKYIDCLNKVKWVFGGNCLQNQATIKNNPSEQKQNNTRKTKHGLRRVSSQTDFISMLYHKLFQFDDVLSEWSKCSESVELLSRKILIRKQYFNAESGVRSNRKKSASAWKNRRSYGQIHQFQKMANNHNSMQLLRSQSNRSRERDLVDVWELKDQNASNGQKDGQNCIVFNDTDKIFENKLEQQQKIQQMENSVIWRRTKNNNNALCSHQTKKQQGTPQLPKYRRENLKIQLQTIEHQAPAVSKQSSQSLKQKVTEFKFSNQIFKRKQPTQLQYTIIEQDVIVQLVKQLYDEVYEINPPLIDALIIGQSLYDIQQNKYCHQSDEQDDEFYQKPVFESLGRQLQDVRSPRDDVAFPTRNIKEFEAQEILQKDRLQNYIIEQEQESCYSYTGVLMYLKELIIYIHDQNWVEAIVKKMNINQSFEALSYLRFLRDFQIPEDEYEPIISNQDFIQWETYYINNIQNKQTFRRQFYQENQDRNLQQDRQSKAIFHRCVFEAFLTELQKQKPYGQKGKPFPWEHNYISAETYQKVLPVDKLSEAFQKSVQNIQKYVVFKCGVIQQKYITNNQNELEKLYEDNEDRIIQMLQKFLQESGHAWYQTEEHCLQIEMQLSYMVEQILFEEAFNQIAKTIKFQ